MGFSRGGQATLYASLRRFHKLWNLGGIDPAAYIALYPPCSTTYIGDTDVTDHPIRIFHGISDDYVEIAPCRSYFERLKQTAKDIQMIEYPDTGHAFDYPLFRSTPTVVPNGQVMHCALKEEPVGSIINTATRRLSCRLAKLIARNVDYRETSTILGHRLKICLNKYLNCCLASVDLHANGRITKIHFVSPTVVSSNDGMRHILPPICVNRINRHRLAALG